MIKIKNYVFGTIDKFKYPFIARLIPDNPDRKIGITYYFLVEIEEKYKNYIPVYAHELVHVVQFWRNPIKHIWYKDIKFNKFYELDIESEAYALQILVDFDFDLNLISNSVIESVAKNIKNTKSYRLNDILLDVIKARLWYYIKKWKNENKHLAYKITLTAHNLNSALVKR